MFTLSERISRLAESETLAMTRRSRELNEQGHHVINLSIGQPDFFTPDYIKAAAKKAIDENFTFYSPVSGYPELRKAICHKLKRDNNLDYSPDQIVVSTGAKQSLTNIMLSLVNPGDEVLVPAPYWVSYREIIKLAEGTMVNINAGVETDFKITPKQLQRAITPKTKAFIYSSPCNPTGSVYSHDELQALAKVFSQHPQISIISDEIYELINFEGKHHSIASFPEIKEQVILVNGVSKGFAMTGWRLGYCAATREIAAACDKIQGQVTSGTCSISQQAAIAAVMNDPVQSAEVKNMVSTFKKRRDLMLNLMAEIPGLRTNTPQGAFYIFPDVTEYYGKSAGDLIINNGTDLCNYLLDHAHIALVSGEAFGNPDCIRISYATSNEALIEAAQRLKKALADLK
ncbi:MAG: pyridoxal phosphate-dependent aminotransferase [Lentimicrobium sp.]|jgi:aspartate aminotransferase|nr:pyridoxal phosphate-dependent aminotransferase [Lentimicrobium sp.]